MALVGDEVKLCQHGEPPDQQRCLIVATFGVSATNLEDVAEMLAIGGRVGLSSGLVASRTELNKVV